MSPRTVDTVNQSPGNRAEDVFEAIHGVMHLIRSRQYRVLRDGPHDLTHMEGKILGFLARHADATSSEIVAHFGRDKGQVARLIRTLRKQRLLTAKADACDRRSVRLRLTQEGRRVHASLQRELTRLTRVATQNLGVADRAALLRLLGKLHTSLETD